MLPSLGPSHNQSCLLQRLAAKKMKLHSLWMLLSIFISTYTRLILCSRHKISKLACDNKSDQSSMLVTQHYKGFFFYGHSLDLKKIFINYTKYLVSNFFWSKNVDCLSSSLQFDCGNSICCHCDISTSNGSRCYIK